MPKEKAPVVPGYSFVEDGHKHFFDGKRMTGVTTVLGVIAKPALIGWAANMAVQHVQEQILKAEPGTILENLDKWLLEARKAHTVKRDKAADIGTLVHKACEEWIKSQTEPTLDEQGMKMFGHFKQWATDNKVKFLESEKHLYSESMFLGGICDMVVEIDGQVWIADIKTGGVYPEAFYQMAAYQMLLEEMGSPLKITGHIILGIKKDGTFEEKRSVSHEEAKEAFLAAFKIYKITQKVNLTIF